MDVFYKYISSPVGRLQLVTSEKKLSAVLWDSESLNKIKLSAMEEDEKNPILLEVEKQLSEYFNQKRKHFELPLGTIGTPFQKAVWKLLSKIPYGVTCSYKEIASQLNNPLAVRAVGSATRKNPISIIIPCHRVIGSNGNLTGFSGGLERKKKLLNLETLKDARL